MVRRRKLWYRVSYASFFVLLIVAPVRIATLAPGSAAGQALVLVLFALALTAPAGMLTALAAELRCSRPAREEAEAVVHPRRAGGSLPLSRATSVQASAITVIVGLLVAVLIELPIFVNSVGYAAGFGGTGVYTPQSRGQQCTRNHKTNQTTCTPVTYGTLTSAGHTTRATYDGTPPLGRPFTVRRPVWDGWSGRPELVDGGLAVPSLGLLLLITYAAEGSAVMALWLRRVSREADAGTAAAGLTAEPEPGT